MATQLTQDRLEVPLYPRTYRVSLGWKLFLVVAGVSFGFGSIAGLVFLILRLPDTGNLPVWATIVLGATLAGFACMGLYTALSALMYRVVLTADGIEVVEPFRRRQLLRQEILGRRMLRAQQGPPTLVLVPNDEKAKKLKIALILKRDPIFDDWCTTLADLDQQELRRSEQEIAETLYQDLMPEERGHRIGRLRSLANWMNVAVISLVAASFLLPDHEHLLTGTLIALPWVAIWLVARFQPLYRFGGNRNDGHPDFSAILMLPGLALTMRAMELRTLDWRPLVMLACAGSLILTGAALKADPWLRQKRWTAVLLGIFACTYGYGAGLEINVLADSAAPSAYTTVVLGKHASHGSKSTIWYLNLAPWGPIRKAGDVSVSAARYRATRTGATLCMYLGAGAFGIPWYQVRDCPGNTLTAF
jgi:hypothetical protein